LFDWLLHTLYLTEHSLTTEWTWPLTGSILRVGITHTHIHTHDASERSSDMSNNAGTVVGHRLPTHTTTHSQQRQVSIEPTQMSCLIHASRLTSEAPKCIQAARLPRAWSTRNELSCDTQDLRPGLAQHETCSHPVHVSRHWWDSRIDVAVMRHATNAAYIEAPLGVQDSVTTR